MTITLRKKGSMTAKNRKDMRNLGSFIYPNSSCLRYSLWLFSQISLLLERKNANCHCFHGDIAIYF